MSERLKKSISIVNEQERRDQKDIVFIDGCSMIAQIFLKKTLKTELI